MGLYEKVSISMINAMKNRDKATLSTIRLLKSAIDLNKINNKLETVDDELVISVASKQVKTHKEDIIEFEKVGRKDLVEGLKKEIKLLETFLPSQLTIEEITSVIDDIFNTIKPEGKQDMGKIMKEANKRLNGKADFKQVSDIVNSKLN
ncbi:MAG: GatB/YqeY domain-containing protein [Bacilli bacterium]